MSPRRKMACRPELSNERWESAIKWHVALPGRSTDMLHRFRVAMVRTSREPLAGQVEVDETMIGGVEKGGKRGRGANKEIVVIAVEIKHPKGFGRIRMRHVPDASANSLEPFVREMIAPGSIVYTDGWGGYNGLSNGYEHRQTILSSSGDPAQCRNAWSSSSGFLIEALVTRYSPGSFYYGTSSIVFGRIYVSI